MLYILFYMVTFVYSVAPNVCILLCVYYTLINKNWVIKGPERENCPVPIASNEKDCEKGLELKFAGPVLFTISFFLRIMQPLHQHNIMSDSPPSQRYPPHPPTSKNFTVAEKYHLDCTVEILTQLFNFPKVRSELANTATLFLYHDSSVLPTHW